MKKKNKYYTVWQGRKPGVYSTWEQCKEQIHGYENAIYKSFATRETADEALKRDHKDFIGKYQFVSSLTESELKLYGFPIPDSICVDGAWNTETHEIEYQGLDLKTGEIIFHAGPFHAGTNNIAEFLGIVHALAHCKKHSISSVIYSDSRTAISWVRKKKANTKIENTEKTTHILSIVKRGEDWLKKNMYSNKILKWETKAWGENPADFGRK